MCYHNIQLTEKSLVQNGVCPMQEKQIAQADCEALAMYKRLLCTGSGKDAVFGTGELAVSHRIIQEVSYHWSLRISFVTHKIILRLLLEF